MMNKKVVLIFIALVIFLLMIIPSVKAADNNPLEVIDPSGNVQRNNTITNENTNNIISNNETTYNNITTNNETNTNITNNTINNTTNNIVNNNVGNTAENKLPQTGVAEDTTLFIFIGICLVSAVYAYMKIRNYRSI